MTTAIFNCTLSDGRAVAVRIRPQAFNILVGDETPSYSFDRAGRLIGAFVGGVNYKRGLDNRVLAKWPGTEGRQRRWLTAEEARAFLDEAYALAEAAAAVCADPRLTTLTRWGWVALQADAARFAEVYRPVSILPPDQYLALVVQATEGCSYNRCTFCDFYRDRPFRIKAPAELREHLRAVAAFFGPGISLRKSLFLADANALVAPMARIRDWLAVIHAARSAGELPGGGIYSFIDAFDVHRKSVADWQELRGRGLQRVYIGMESGDDALLRFLRKPGNVGDVIEAVAALKAAGLAVSVIIMTGIGGAQYAAGHVEHTIAALNAMPLVAGDIIYFSPFVDQPGSEYTGLAAEGGIAPLMPAQMQAQEAAITAGLRPCRAESPPQRSRYNIREFLY